MMKKVLLTLILASSFSLAASNADAAFRDLDCEFGECSGNPNDPEVKQEQKKEATKQDRYAPREEKREEPRYADRYTPAQQNPGKRFYQYIGFGASQGIASMTNTNTYTYYESTYDFNYNSSQFRYGLFMPNANMKLEVSVGVGTHADPYDTSYVDELTELNYDLMIGKASMNTVFGSFGYVKVGLTLQTLLPAGSYDSISLGGLRLGAGYSIILGKFLEGYIDYTWTAVSGSYDDVNYDNHDLSFTTGSLGAGLNILF